MTSSLEETSRRALALIRACITDDEEGKHALLAHLTPGELERLSIALAGYAGHLMQQPATDASTRLDGLFELLDSLSNGGDE